MNSVPLLFVETVARLLDFESLSALNDLASGNFGNAGRSLWKKRLFIYLNVVYNSTAKTFEYCLRCRRIREHSAGPMEAYTYDPADHRFVRYFRVRLFSDRSSLNIPQVTWTSATPSDPTLLILLRTPFRRTYLDLRRNCPEFLKLLPGYCTFNWISARNVYNKVLDAIIQRSQECGRLETIYCTQFFKKRGRRASINWITINKRLQRVSNRLVRNADAIGAALTAIGVQ